MDLKKGKVILPSTLTSFSLVLGFLAVISCFSEHPLFNLQFTLLAGCWMVIFASILDGLDGKIARLTKTTSDFGTHYDSMADIITFGVAPAVILYKNFLIGTDPVYLIFPILFVLSSAIRLSRFNTTATQKAKLYNTGLPMPVSGGFLCATILLINFLKSEQIIMGTEGYIFPSLLAIAIFLSCQMISTIKYDLFFNFWFKVNPIRPLRYGIILSFICVLIFVDPAVFFFSIGAYYICYCCIRHLYFRSQGDRAEAYGEIEEIKLGKKEE